MKCADCKYWGEGDDGRDALYGTKRCGKALQMWDAGHWDGEDYDSNKGYTLLHEHAGQMMFVKDGSDYRADLYTKPDFFCAHFEEISKP